MGSIDTLLIYFYVNAKWYVIIPTILFKILEALYFKVLRVPNWWVALIPFGHLYLKYEMADTKIILLILQAILELIGIILFSSVCWIIAAILNVICNIKVADDCLEVDHFTYALIPFGKISIMINKVWKEMIKLENTESR